MCLLSYFPEGIQPDPEELRNGSETNYHGHGYAIVAGNRLLINKSMDPELLIAEFVNVRAQHARGPALFHSRYGTGGSVDVSNCHPFYFGNDKRTIVAHNGVLPNVAQPVDPKDTRCDTRYAADLILPYWFGHLSWQSARRDLEKWLTDYNKLVILTVNPEYPERSYIINEGSGYWTESGIWYSCSDYKGYSPYNTYSGPLSWPRANDCFLCGIYGDIDPVSRVCKVCNFCADCEEEVNNCMCWVPDQDSNSAREYTEWWKDATAPRPTTEFGRRIEQLMLESGSAEK